MTWVRRVIIDSSGLSHQNLQHSWEFTFNWYHKSLSVCRSVSTCVRSEASNDLTLSRQIFFTRHLIPRASIITCWEMMMLQLLLGEEETPRRRRRRKARARQVTWQRQWISNLPFSFPPRFVKLSMYKRKEILSSSLTHSGFFIFYFSSLVPSCQDQWSMNVLMIIFVSPVHSSLPRSSFYDTGGHLMGHALWIVSYDAHKLQKQQKQQQQQWMYLMFEFLFDVITSTHTSWVAKLHSITASTFTYRINRLLIKKE